MSKWGNYRYMAPEHCSWKHQCDEKVDVWSYGVVLWVMLTHKIPYSEIKEDDIVQLQMINKLFEKSE